eukprot:5030830-Prymnesium_polylepis.1
MASDDPGGRARSGRRVMGRQQAQVALPAICPCVLRLAGLLLVRAFYFWCLLCEGTSWVERGSGHWPRTREIRCPAPTARYV